MKAHPILVKAAERNAARQRLAREGIVCGPKAPNGFLARSVALALGLPLPKDLAEQAAMIRAYAVPYQPKGPLAEGRKFEFRPWVPDKRWLEAVARARACSRGPAIVDIGEGTDA